MGHLLARQLQRREVFCRCKRVGRTEVAEFEAVLVDPAAIGLLLRECFLDLAVVADGAVGSVHREHLAGTEAALPDDTCIVDDDGTGLRADVEQTVFRDLVA